MFCKYCGNRMNYVNGKCQICGHEIDKLEGVRKIDKNYTLNNNEIGVIEFKQTILENKFSENKVQTNEESEKKVVKNEVYQNEASEKKNTERVFGEKKSEEYSGKSIFKKYYKFISMALGGVLVLGILLGLIIGKAFYEEKVDNIKTSGIEKETSYEKKTTVDADDDSTTDKEDSSDNFETEDVTDEEMATEQISMEESSKEEVSAEDKILEEATSQEEISVKEEKEPESENTTTNEESNYNH